MTSTVEKMASRTERLGLVKQAGGLTKMMICGVSKVLVLDQMIKTAQSDSLAKTLSNNLVFFPTFYVLNRAVIEGKAVFIPDIDV